MPTPYLPRVATIPIMPNLPPWLAFTQGNFHHVLPHSGLDENSGRSPVQAFKTLAAVVAATGGSAGASGLKANQNDAVLLYAENNDTSAYTTDYQATMLNWSKDLTHLIGVNGGAPFSPRCRIAAAAPYASANPMMTVSADGCSFSNLGLFLGVASVLPIGCLSVTGSRNRFESCHIAGIGNDANDIANAYSLSVSGDENYFKNCIIGLDTVSRGSADNCELLMAGGARNIFDHCRFISFAAVNTHHFVKRASNTTDRFTTFLACSFQNFDWAGAGGATMLEVFDATASAGSPGGLIDLDPDCWFSGALAWETNAGASGIVRAATKTAAAASATSAGRALAVTGI